MLLLKKIKQTKTKNVRNILLINTQKPLDLNPIPFVNFSGNLLQKAFFFPKKGFDDFERVKKSKKKKF